MRRFKDHSKTKGKYNFKKSVIITSNFFNKSAVYDIETRLIEYIFADNQYEVINKKTNQSSHEYYMKKDINNALFRSLWQRLRDDGIAKSSLFDLENSEVFKYSPFKQFSIQQVDIVNEVVSLISNDTDEKIISYDGEAVNRKKLSDDESSVIIKGGAGTGKTLLIIKLVYDLLRYYKIGDINIAICIPQTSLQPTFKKLLRNMKLKAEVIRPIDLSKNLDQKYDLLIVDEAHRLKRHFPKQTKDLKHLEGGKYTEFDFSLIKSKNLVLMFDDKQSVRPADIHVKDMIVDDFHQYKLDQQFRVKAGGDYLKFIQALLQITDKEPPVGELGDYTFEIVDSLKELHDVILQKQDEVGLSRMSAGYYKKWISKKDTSAYDFIEGNLKLQWNTTISGWVQSKNAINEVGCIHTLQGQDLNYAGVILGEDIYYDEADGVIKVDRSNYFDRNGTPVKGTDEGDVELTKLVKNIYYVLLSRGMLGTYLLIEDPALKKYVSNIIAK
jgi:hypothetical protein